MVGYSNSISGIEAFRWTSAGMVGLGDLAGGVFSSRATGVSADGSVVVGFGTVVQNNQSAFRWTQGGSMVDLGALILGGLSGATGVSADGNVVVGYSSNGNNGAIEAFRWQNGVMTGLGDLAGGTYSRANAVSADGNVVVGRADNATSDQAFRWTQAGGIVTVVDWLTAAGVSTAAWTVLEIANATNTDGSVVVGVGTSTNGTEAFIARADSSVTGIVGLTDLSNSLASQLAPHVQLESLNYLTLNGAHHKPLTDIAMSDGQSCGWVSGDVGRTNTDANGWYGLAEVGGCHDFADKALRAGLGIGHSQSSLDYDNNGHSRLKGEYVLAELDWTIPNSSLTASVLGMAGRWNADIRRGYSAGTATSTGETDLNSASLRARLDWKDAFTLGAINFTPNLQYTVTRTRVDGYQETGGTAPARFDSQRHTAQESRLGLTGAYEVSDATTLYGHTEWAHRFDSDAASVSGNANVLNVVALPFNIKGNDIRQDWVRVGAEVVHSVNERNRLSVSGNVASAGQDADLSMGVSWNLLF